jgi:hypothetical protein
MNSIRLVTIAAILGLAFSPTQGRTQEPDNKGAAIEPAKMSEQDLHKMLVGLNHQPTERKTKSGRPSYLIKFTAEGMTVSISVSLSPSRKLIWLSSSLRSVPDPEKSSAKPWQTLLSKNNEIGAAHFTYNEATRMIGLSQPVPTQGLTAESLKVEIDAFVRNAVKTRAAWEPKNWSASTAGDATASTAAPGVVSVEGTNWRFVRSGAPLEFLKDGKLRIVEGSGTWKQTGRSVTVQSEGQSSYELTLEGDSLKGQWQPPGLSKRPIEFRRIASNSVGSPNIPGPK